jgi:hypothetical protein
MTTFLHPSNKTKALFSDTLTHKPHWCIEISSCCITRNATYSLPHSRPKQWLKKVVTWSKVSRSFNYNKCLTLA